MLQPHDMELCRSALKNLTSEENSKKNFLFLQPVDLTNFPTYVDVVKRPMDLDTLGKNLEANRYSSREEFFKDAMLCFENAITFHAKNREMHWIIKLAKDMIKLLKTEKRIVDKKAKEAKAAKSKAKANANAHAHAHANAHAKTNSTSTKKTSSSSNKKDKDTTSTIPSTATATATATATNTTQKQPLKIKFSAAAAAKSADASTLNSSSTHAHASSTIPTKSKPKVSLKLKPPASTLSSSAAASSASASTEKKTSKPKPKLKLTLSLGSKSKTKKSDTSTSAPPPHSSIAPTNSNTNTNTAPPASAAPPTKPAPAAKSPPKLQVRLNAGSRGKELPKGVSPSATTSTTKPNKKITKTKGEGAQSKKSKKSSSSAPKLPTAQKSSATNYPLPPNTSSKQTANGITYAPMTPKRKAQCIKVLTGLRRRKAHKEIKWFTSPFSDKALIDDYKAKIPHPIDLGTMMNKLERNEYASLLDFCLDLRRIFANCLRYNTTVQDSFRPLAIDLLAAAEELMAVFIAKNEAPNMVYPPLLYCWRLCVSILDAVINIKNPTDGHQTAHYFLHPVAFYFGGSLPMDYSSKVKRPMDIGSVTSMLLEGQYQTVQSFASDCLLIKENCVAYYGGSPDGGLFVELAGRLHELMKRQLDALMRYDQSPASSQSKTTAMAVAAVKLPKPPPAFLLNIIKDLRALKYTDKFTKITQPAMDPFEKPVDLTLYPDYLTSVETAMDLGTVESRAQSGLYETPEDFEYDVKLIFQNCETFNAPRKSQQMVAMGKYGAKMFRKIFTKRMEPIDNPALAQQRAKEESSRDQKRPITPSSSSSQPTKKQKFDTDTKPPGGKAAPRISITASTVTSAPGGGKSAPTGGKAVRSKSPVKGSSTSQKKKSVTSKKNQPVPLHVAIAKVKERFPLRRPYKLLQTWEGACARFFRELMKHPWINAARPKFIFHVPVPVLFPELEESYAAKIQKPMDLTTTEAKLLQGGLYRDAQEFVDEVALVFANAITFNKDGHDVGEPMSCAYYDASIHLLRYARWLSLEHLAEYLSEDAHVDEIKPNEIPPTSWKLTKANRKKAREEMENIFMTESIERSIEGDRYTWTEGECEKLLKALRHQSDLKHMTFFIATHYPADYAAYIAKPMDWEKVHRTLQKREYDKFGDVVADIRLIFSNAIKYNARAKGTETVSGKAYDAAVYMSRKLEIAIDKAMLSVSDRLERERIDHNIGEREIEAAERAEQARLKELWSKQGETGEIGQAQVETIEFVRVVNRRPTQRKEMMDFENPYFDEDDGHHERSHNDAQKQLRVIFERQRQSRTLMRNKTLAAGSSVFDRLAKYNQTMAIAKKMVQAAKQKAAASAATPESANRNRKTDSVSLASSILPALNKEGRAQISMRPKVVKKKKKRKAAFLLE